MTKTTEETRRQPQSERIDSQILEEVQRREQTRLIMLFFFFAVLAVLSLVRQLLGCESMQGSNLVWRLGLLMVGIFHCSRMLYVLGRANAAGRVVGSRYWLGTSAFELGLVLLMIGANEFFAPTNRTIDDLSAPITLLIPLLIVLSVMRLRPRLTLWTGIIGGGFHAGLALNAYLRARAAGQDDVQPSILPTILTFSIMLLILGFAGSVVSSELLNLARGSRRGIEQHAS